MADDVTEVAERLRRVKSEGLMAAYGTTWHSAVIRLVGEAPAVADAFLALAAPAGGADDLRAEVEKLRAALAPFAAMADPRVNGYKEFALARVSLCEAAREALGGPPAGGRG